MALGTRRVVPRALTRKLIHADVAARIAQVRKRLGLRRYEFAEKLSVSRASVTNYEKGQMPRADVLGKIASLAGVPVEWLLQGTKLPTRQTIGASPSSRRDVERVLWKFFELQVTALPESYVSQFRNRIRGLLKQLTTELKENSEKVQREHRAQHVKQHRRTRPPRLR